MKLINWLKTAKNGKPMPQAEFAKLIFSDQPHVSDLITGKVKPTMPTIDIVEKVTKGKVRYPDWRPSGVLSRRKQ